MDKYTPIERLMQAVEMTPLPHSDPAETSELPYATHEGYLQIGDISIRCYQLNDGRRLIDANDPFIKSLIEGLKEL
jgi:hypothetical protein